MSGRAAIEVRKTMIMLACDLNTHKLSNMDTTQKAAPRNNSFIGLCSALNGVINDSRTMHLSSFLLFINLLEKGKAKTIFDFLKKG
jgi:hypothetical protein